jgi:hypothetical protein
VCQFLEQLAVGAWHLKTSSFGVLVLRCPVAAQAASRGWHLHEALETAGVE